MSEYKVYKGTNKKATFSIGSLRGARMRIYALIVADKGKYPYTVRQDKTYVADVSARMVNGAIASVIWDGADGRKFRVLPDGGMESMSIVKEPRPTARMTREEDLPDNTKERWNRKVGWGKQRTGNMPVPERANVRKKNDKGELVNLNKGRWVIVRRDDRNNSMSFMSANGEWTFNIKEALRYTDDRMVKVNGESVKIKGDKVKATNVARRLNKERKSRKVTYFVAKIAVDKKTNEATGLLIAVGTDNEGKRMEVVEHIAPAPSSWSDKGGLVLSLDGQIVKRAMNLDTARLIATTLCGYTKTVAISKNRNGTTEPLGIVNLGKDGYVWWSLKETPTHAYDVKGRRVNTVERVGVHKFAIQVDGSVKPLQVGESMEDQRNRRLVEEFAKSGINFKVETVRKRK